MIERLARCAREVRVDQRGKLGPLGRRDAGKVLARVGVAAGAMLCDVVGEQPVDVGHRSASWVEPGAELGAEARGDLGDVVLAHPVDPAANLGRSQPAEHVQLDHSRCFSLKVSRTSSTMIRSSTAPASLSIAGSAPHTSSSPACSLGRIVSFGRRSARLKKSTAVRSTIVCSQLRNSPTELPSNAAAIALTSASCARSSTTCVGHLDRKAPLDVALVAVDQEHQAAAAVRELSGVASVADVGDQLLVGELLEFVVGKRLKAHGGGTAEVESASADAKLTQGSANSRRQWPARPGFSASGQAKGLRP